MLNKEQKRAVEHKKGPLLIIAGAGAGKTTVVTERIKFLIDNKLAEPEEILALTFTEKASAEMQERVDMALPIGYSQMWISTFHSFCDRLLRDEGLEIGLDPKFELLTQARAMKLIRDNIFDLGLDYYLPLGNPNKFVYGLLSHFSRLQDEDISLKDYLKWAKDSSTSAQNDIESELEKKKYLELASAYNKYDQLKIEKSVMDFGDLVAKALWLFKTRPNILKKYREKFKYILVDEFQDTNYSQNKLAMSLSGKAGNITVVGDDDQSIYRFRGAAVSNILQFREVYPKAKTVVLNKNYRSGQEILDASYRLVSHNNPDRLEVKEGVDKKLIAQRKVKSEISFLHLKNDTEEAEAIAKQITQLGKDEGYNYFDFAVLVRANSHAEPIINTFEKLGVPHQFLGPAKLFEQSEIIDLISFLRVMADPEDDQSLARLMTISNLHISEKFISLSLARAKKDNKSLIEVIEGSSDKHVKKLIDNLNALLEKSQTEHAGVLLYNFLQTAGLLQDLVNPDSEETVVKVNNIAQFFDRLKSLEKAGQRKVSEALEWIDLVTELGESPIVHADDWSEQNKVNILTVHSSKGLEFPVVFMPNLVHLRFPSMNRREQIPVPGELIKESLPQGDFHMQEERRLFYVGMTRARDKLYFTAADYYGEAKSAKKLSPFIFEALGDSVIPSEAEGSENRFLPSSAGRQDGRNDKKVNVKEKPRKDHHVHYLSYSQIEAFKICPLHYKLRYILKMPTPPSAALSLGTSVHETMNDLYLLAKKGEDLDEKFIKKMFKSNWINSGYLNKSHSEKSYKHAEKYIINYFKYSFDENRSPLLLEEPFVISLPAIDGYEPLKIGGKIDRIDKLGEEEIEIIDYKTGSNIPSPREVDKNLQLSIYALAASQLKIKSLGKVKKIILSLVYLESGEKISTTRTKAQLDAAVKEIYEAREQIEESDFKCSDHMFCQRGCEFEMFCKSG